MTETRKQIIEIIKPCMDKTKANGILVRLPDGSIEQAYGVNNADESKFVGHYDITAVETLFLSKGYTLKIHTNTYEVSGKGVLEGKEYNDVYYGFFNRKPLHLYTQEEENNLLELLKKLGPIL